MMRRHVLVIPSWYASEYNPANGGFFRDQCLALHRAGAQVGVVYPELRRLRSFRPAALAANHFQTQWLDDDGVPTLRYQGWAAPARVNLPLWRRAALRLFDRYVERFGRPDLIHAHGAQTAGCAAAYIKSRRDIPYVLTEHSSAFARGLFPEWKRPALEAAFAGARCVAAVSASLSDSIAPWLGDRRDAVEVIPNLVDTEFFDLPDRRPPASPFRVLCVALLNANKRVDVLLRAFASAFEDREVCLEIGGDGPERPRLEALARELGIESRVRFLGLLSREQVRDAMHRSHLFVLSSVRETFGLVCVEAMACGLPVLATRSGGPEEIVHADVGWLVPPEDVDALAEGLARAHESGVVDRDRADAIRDDASRRFGEQAVTTRLFALYARALDTSADPTAVAPGSSAPDR